VRLRRTRAAIFMEATAHLQVVHGAGAGTVREIGKPKLVLGRHPDCDISIENLDVSRHHAQILRIQDEFFLEDLHSTNGTFLNDQPLRKRRKIAAGDRIRISNVTFEFHCGDSPLASAAARTVAAQVSPRDEAGNEKSVVLPQGGAPFEKIADGSSIGLRAELKALLRIAQSLRTSPVLDEVLGPILDALFLIFPAADRGFIVLDNEDGSLAPRWTKFRHGAPAASIPVSLTVAAKVMESQRAVLSANIAADRRFPPSDSPDEAPNRSVMCAPLTDGAGGCFGALQLDGSDAGQPFRDDDLEIFVAVAIQVSIAIDNARLHEKKSRQQNAETERDFADRLQQGILPWQAPEIPGYEFYQYYCPVAHTGGDFYDYVLLCDGRLMVFMADITGHGAAAAMLIARLALEIRSSLLISSTPRDMLRNLNQALFRCLPQDQFIKLVAAELVPATGEVTLVNAGHQQPLLRSPDGETSQLGGDQAGLPLGVDADAEYSEVRHLLPLGGTLIFYTDGLGQATAASGQAYGHPRIRTLAATTPGGAAEIGQQLVADVRQFIAAAEQRDDICIVCLGRKASGAVNDAMPTIPIP
jgi:serine phosphatase RsbU (regulator of sigma subunit)